MSLILSILILLITALILGELVEHFGIPAVVGEIIAGVIFGPSVLDLIKSNSVLSGISEISLFFIILLIGVDQTTETLKKHLGKAFALSLSSFIVPSAIMSAIAFYYFGLPASESILVSVAVGIPSISIISVMVRGYNIEKSELGMTIIASVIVSDTIAFTVTSAFRDEITFIYGIVSIVVFLILLFILDLILRSHSDAVKNFFSRIRARERGEKVIFGSIIVGGLIISAIFEVIGITYVLGAFFAGLLINELVLGAELQGVLTRTLGRIDDSFFIPVFFAIAGLDFIIPSTQYLLLLLVLLAVSGLFASLLNYFTAGVMLGKQYSRTVMGFLGGRGAVGIAIATVALSAGLIGKELYSNILIATIVLSLIIPSLINLKTKGREPSLDN
ncbi:MAG: cation:proton antiporter [Candidatus Thermoplasmatota archaeon]|nr:cation:proton antiporter [Candidatus Thermoplasmatota archaeon]